jgi:hypothetical protein
MNFNSANQKSAAAYTGLPGTSAPQRSIASDQDALEHIIANRQERITHQQSFYKLGK